MRKITWLICALLMVILSACSGNTIEKKSEDNQPESKTTQHGGDIREETASAEELPSFLTNKSENMQTIYAAAAQHKELLEQMPCYCGCGGSVGHKDNYDCFIHENEGNKVTWDDHGTKCQVCLEIAAEAINESQNGKSNKEIRESIDNKYKEGYAEPTPTPAVS